MKKKVLIKIERCIGCNTCEFVCEKEHGGVSLIRVINRKNQHFPLMCQHCSSAPCVMVCYKGALSLENNIVIFNQKACTQCGLCIVACPFGAIFFTRDFIPQKCDACRELQEKGHQPVCASACPSGALVTEDIDIFAGLKRRKYFNTTSRQVI